ncbi:hypothetical protein WN944_020780 [Citrus x changshan-huyou]|uniref:adenosylhomocysteinase n=1 Tax=Citrus x changshan-huyou TaxID=2935761 RepID=A0AAP0LVP0_9ROSI
MNISFQSAYQLQDFAKKFLYRFFFNVQTKKPDCFPNLCMEHLFLTGLTLSSLSICEDELWYMWCLTALYATKLVLPIKLVLTYLTIPEFSPDLLWTLLEWPYFQHPETRDYWTQAMAYKWRTYPHPYTLIHDTSITYVLKAYLMELNNDPWEDFQSLLHTKSPYYTVTTPDSPAASASQHMTEANEEKYQQAEVTVCIRSWPVNVVCGRGLALRGRYWKKQIPEFLHILKGSSVSDEDEDDRSMKMPHGMMEDVLIQPFKGANITGSLHMTVQTTVLIGTLTALGAEVRWWSCNIFSIQDHVAATIARNFASVFRVKAKEIYEKTRKLPDLASIGNTEFQIVLTITRDGLKADPKKYHKMKEILVGVSEETTTGVKRLYQMQENGTLLFPAINVNDSITNRKFDDLYGYRHSLLDGLMRATDVMIFGKVAVVCGYGDVGNGCAATLKQVGACVIVTDIDLY